MNIEKKKERSASVDLIKLIACLFIICVHCETFIPGVSITENSRLIRLVYSTVNIGVGMFFVQSGFFMFRGREAGPIRKWLGYIKKLLVPALITAVLLSFLKPYVMELPAEPFELDLAGLVSCFTHPDTRALKEGLNAIIHFQTVPTPHSFGHLWFMITYSKLILLAPLFSYVCTDGKNETIIRRVMMVILALYYILELDLRRLLNISLFDGYDPVSCALFMPLLGYEIYEKKDQLAEHPMRNGLIAAGVFILLTVIRQFLVESTGKGQFLKYEGFVQIMQAAVLCIAILTLPEMKGKAGKLISYLGERTFLVYLLHWPISVRLCRTGSFRALFQGLIGAGTPGVLCAYLLSSLICFTITMVLCIALHEIWKGIKRGYYKIKGKIIMKPLVNTN